MLNISMKHSIAVIFLVCILTPVFLFADDEKQTYECANNDMKVTFTVKPGEVDKVSGKIVFLPKSSQTFAKINGIYDIVTNTVIATSKKNNTNKRKAVSGFLDLDTGEFNLNIYLTKTEFTTLVCPKKKDKDDLLSGTWVINDTSFFRVTITEEQNGDIVGFGLKGFEGYLLEGEHLGDIVYIRLFSPDGNDDAQYQLALCESQATMKGEVFTGVSRDAVWCRKNRAVNNECSVDTTCGP